MAGITERTKTLRKTMISKATCGKDYVSKVSGCMERARLWTESFKATEGEPWVIRRAKATANVIDNVTIFIKEPELIVGYPASRPEKMPFHPEGGYQMSVAWLFDDPDMLTDEEKEELKGIGEYWKSRSLEKRVTDALTPEEHKLNMTNVSYQSTTYFDALSSAAPDWEFYLKHGLNGIIKKIEARKKEIDDSIHVGPSSPSIKENIPKSQQLEAMLISCKAAIRFGKRYSELAEEAAKRCDDSEWKADLKKISKTCARIPGEPSETLQEALQAVWFGQLIHYAFERHTTGASMRPDQAYWPVYEKQVLKDKTLTKEEALELLECARIKYAELGRLGSQLWREQLQGAGEVLIQTIGGQNADGSDACNKLTDLIIDAAMNVRTNQPSLAFRWHPKVSRKALAKVADCVKTGLGYPSIMNDVVSINSILSFGGVTIEEARNWSNVLCMSPGVLGKKGTRIRNPWSIMAIKCFELALYDGFDGTWIKEYIGVRTGDARKFKTYEELVNAYRLQVRFVSEIAARTRVITRYFEGIYMQQPFLSSTYEGCIDNAVDGVAWDEVANPWVNTLGCVDTADSLAAIKKLVFDEKKYTMDQLITALEADWKGYDKMRKDFIDAPKFGNDDNYVDKIASEESFAIIVEELEKNKNYSDGPFKPLPQALAGFWSHGRKTGALPSGRLSGTPLSDGGCSHIQDMIKKDLQP